jgi:hypothetical protein
VEQAPIDEAATGFSSPSNQCMATRLEADDRKRSAKITELGDVLAIQSTGPDLAGMTQAGAAKTVPAGFAPLHEDFDSIGSCSDQPITHASTEAASVRHQVEGFEQAGLARAIVARDQIQPRSRGH